MNIFLIDNIISNIDCLTWARLVVWLQILRIDIYIYRVSIFFP